MAFKMAQDSQAWLKIASDRPPRGLKTASIWPKIAEHGSRQPPTASSRAWLKIASKRPQESWQSILDGLVGIREASRIVAKWRAVSPTGVGGHGRRPRPLRQPGRAAVLQRAAESSAARPALSRAALATVAMCIDVVYVEDCVR